MRGRLLARVSVLLTVALALGVSFARPAVGQTVRTPTSKEQCKDGGWRTLTDETGHAFRNQGQCVSWANHHPSVLGLADLTGSFSATSSITFAGAGCSFVHQVFDATYPGSTSVGIVTLHIDGCVSPSYSTPLFFYSGTLSLTTAVGTVSGDFSNDPVLMSTSGLSLTYDLTVAITTGTGEFANTTGQTLVATILSGTAITGTITVP